MSGGSLRVLTIGALYPPHHTGGAALVWQELVEELRTRGHRARVLASDFRLDGATAPDDPDARRELPRWWRGDEFPRLSALDRARLVRASVRTVRDELRSLRPHAVVYEDMGGLALSTLETVRRARVPAIGVVNDHWLVYGPQKDGWLSAWSHRPAVARRLAALAAGVATTVRVEDAARWVFLSRYLMRDAQAAHPGLRGEILHPGVDPADWPRRPPGPWRWKLACVGRIDRAKGTDLAVAALEHLPPETTLTVSGFGNESHTAEFRELARSIGAGDRVAWDTSRTRAELPALYETADALLHLGRWDEPWGLVPLEAMASGVPVIATATGGSAEYLRDGENCIVVEREDVAGAVRALRALAGDPALRERLVAGGFETASRYTMAAYRRAAADMVEEVGSA